PGPTCRKEVAARRAVEDGVAHDDVLVGGELGIARGHKNDLAAAHALTDVVVRLALEDQADTPGQKRPEALTATPLQTNLERAIRQPITAMAAGYLVGQTGADRPIAVRDRIGQREPLAGFPARRAIRDDAVDERVFGRRIVALLLLPHRSGETRV